MSAALPYGSQAQWIITSMSLYGTHVASMKKVTVTLSGV